MESIEKTLYYFPLVMKYDDLSDYKKYSLPKGFKYQFYKPGDEEAWISIHLESGEFTDEEEASTHFHEYYDDFIDELSKRCVFIVDSSTGEKVGTATISLFDDKERGYEATVDWVAIKKSYQGRGLAKPLMSKFMEIAVNNGHDKILLHTQSHTWLAAKLYLDYGFDPILNENADGWKLLNTIIDHPKLSSMGTVDKKDIYSPLYIAIVDKLKIIHGNDFTYEIWDKHGMNRISVRCNNKVFKYNFSILDGDVVIEPYSLNITRK